jgi:hypothetical protein
MKTIKCSICNHVEDMRNLNKLFENGELWFEDEINDLCPECFSSYVELSDPIKFEYKAKMSEILEGMKSKTPEQPINVVKIH